MRVHVDEIPESGRFLHLHWGEDRFQRILPPDDPLTIRFQRPVIVDLELHKRPDHIRVQGSIRAEFGLACHRCLETYPWRLEQNDEEMDYEFFDGDEIDVDLLVAGQIFLTLPFKALCSEECKGICPRCGANLNLEPCRCGGGQVESPFAALQAIKQRLPGKANS
jgi:uncharacterized protein